MPTSPKIACVHDWLASYTGAEKVLESIVYLYPEIDIYTLVYYPQLFTTSVISQRPITTSFIQNLPGAKKNHRTFLPLMPMAIEQFDLSAYDIIISSSHAVAKGCLTKPSQFHLSYVHTPIRYAWDLQTQYLLESGLEKGIRSFFVRLILHYIRLWDYQSAQRVDSLVSNSYYTAERVRKYYRREPDTVIYPPVDVERFDFTRPRKSYYLTVSRLVPYKKVDLIVEAFNKLGLPLVVIGGGPDLARIRAMAAPNIQVLGNQPDDVLKEYLETCKAFVFAADEDFGIAPLEAQAAGAPVIAFGRGGALETILPNRTGLFFFEQSPASLIEAVRQFEELPTSTFSTAEIRANAQRFSQQTFDTQFQTCLNRAWEKFQENRVKF